MNVKHSFLGREEIRYSCRLEIFILDLDIAKLYEWAFRVSKIIRELQNKKKEKMR